MAAKMENDIILVPLCFVADVLGVGAGFANDTVILSTRPAQRIPMLVYHHILPDEKNRTQQTNAAVISTENFEQQMRYLYDNNFYTITLDELEAFLYRGRPLPENSVMIHFDDGYYSNFVYAYPILQRYGLRAVVFFITHLIEDLGDVQPPMDHDGITWTAAHTISGTEDVFETASHSHNMHRLAPETDSTILAMETWENILHDTRRSFEFVSNHAAYAYPRGQYNDIIIGALEEAGITMAFTVRNGYVTENSDPMRLDRFVIFRETAFWRFRSIVNGRV
jgi:peptidoglycan/xylan/chitin deacetylase (PgdA/CDA1 family)